ncbi:MAG: hypothetical protein ACR2JC_04405 [Chloroflexota bacterium]
MDCPRCAVEMTDVTDTWHTFAEAQGAEYLAAYVTIWRCANCGTVLGTGDEHVEWVVEPDVLVAEE